MKYTKTHEWIKPISDTEGLVGITNHAQEELSDIVHVELPEVGKVFNRGDTLVTIESVKAASDIYAPLDGEVIEVNESLIDQPEKINESPQGDGWLLKIKIKNLQEIHELLTQTDYQKEIGK